MRADVVRIYRAVHSWTGVTTGLILFIAFYAGALTMFKEPLDRWLEPPTQTVLTEQSLNDANRLIEQTLAQHPAARPSVILALQGGPGIDLPSGGDTAAALRLTWTQSRYDTAPWSASLGPTGQIEVEKLDPSGIGQLVDFLHRTAGLPGSLDIGTAITGVASALYVVALISGLIILLPSLVKDFLALRIRSNAKRMWTDAHNVVGLVSLPFHVAIALTAVVFGLHDPIYDALDHVVYEGRLSEITRADYPPRGPRDKTPAEMLDAALLLANVREIAPTFTPTRMQYQDAGTRSAEVRVFGHDHQYLMRREGYVLVNAVDGKILNTGGLPGQQGIWSAIVASFFALHFGSFGGGIVQWSYFLLGLGGAFLFCTGNLLWIEARRKAKRRGSGLLPQTRSSRWLAAGTVGVCLGCIAGLSVSIAAGKWLNTLAGTSALSNVYGWHWGLYYGVFLASCAYAFWRGAPKAAVELLWLCAVSTALIPATTLLAALVPSTGLWVRFDQLGVELVALAGAAGFAWMAVATSRRTRLGAEDSVWSDRGRTDAVTVSAAAE